MMSATTAMLDMRNITPLPSGAYRVRIERSGAVLGGIEASVEAAAALRDAIKRQIADDDLVPARGRTIAELGREFLASRSGNRSSKSDSGRWQHIGSSSLGKRVPSTVTVKDVVNWLAALQTKKTNYDAKTQGKRETKLLSRQTRKHALNLLRCFFVWAVEQEHATSNPCVGLQVARRDGDESEGYQEGWHLDAADQARMLEILKDDPERWIVAFAIGTGLRQGEQWCLHIEDVHIDGDDPHVLVRFGSWDAKKQRYRPPKGRAGEKKSRRVPLFGLGLEAATEWLKLLPTYAPDNPLGLMFPTPAVKKAGQDGQRDYPGGSRRVGKTPGSWAKVVAKLDVPRLGRKPWWHLLRHTCASSLVSGWWGQRWRLEDVRMVLGHSSLKVTERYAHLVPNAVQGVANAAQVAWASRHGAVTTFSANPKKASDLTGTPGRTRTCDQRLRRPLLYPTELRARAMHKLR